MRRPRRRAVAQIALIQRIAHTELGADTQVVLGKVDLDMLLGAGRDFLLEKKAGQPMFALFVFAAVPIDAVFGVHEGFRARG